MSSRKRPRTEYETYDVNWDDTISQVAMDTDDTCECLSMALHSTLVLIEVD